jgi:hypothetical protein
MMLFTGTGRLPIHCLVNPSFLGPCVALPSRQSKVDADILTNRVVTQVYEHNTPININQGPITHPAEFSSDKFT